MFHFSSQTSRNPNIRTMKADSMGKTMPDSSWRCNYSITFTPKWSFFSSDCVLNFGPLHLLLSITSKQIKLQMWDCAQKKALEKSFNLVTNKSCLKWAKGPKMSYRKTCVFLIWVVIMQILQMFFSFTFENTKHGHFSLFFFFAWKHVSEQPTN